MNDITSKKGKQIMKSLELDHYSDIYEPHPISDVELLGHAKNNIVEVQEMELSLPPECWDMLSQAFKMLDQVQEFLYNH